MESACNVGDLGLIPGSGSSPGEGNGNPLQYSCLENSMDRGAWWATAHGVAKESPTYTVNCNHLSSCCLVAKLCLTLFLYVSHKKNKVNHLNSNNPYVGIFMEL